MVTTIWAFRAALSTKEAKIRKELGTAFLYGLVFLATRFFLFFLFLFGGESGWLDPVQVAITLLQAIIFADLWFRWKTEDYVEDGLLLAVVWFPMVFIFDAFINTDTPFPRATTFLASFCLSLIVPIVSLSAGIMLAGFRPAESASDQDTRESKGSGRGLLMGGFVIWAVHFVSALLLYPYRYGNLSLNAITKLTSTSATISTLADAIFPAIIAATTAICLVIYFRQIKGEFLKQGLIVGLTWFIINVTLDAAVFKLDLFATKSLVAYLQSDGFNYLIIPILAINAGFLLTKHSKANPSSETPWV